MARLEIGHGTSSDPHSQYVLDAGDTMTGDLILNDNVNLTLGTDSDITLDFDGTNTVLTMSGSSNFQVTGGNKSIILDENSTIGLTAGAGVGFTAGSPIATQIAEGLLVTGQTGLGTIIRVQDGGGNGTSDLSIAAGPVLHITSKIAVDGDAIQDSSAADIIVLGGSHQLDLSSNPATYSAGMTFSGPVKADGGADAVQLIAQGGATQTNDIFLVEKSDNTELVAVDNAGAVTVLDSVSIGTTFPTARAFRIDADGSTADFIGFQRDTSREFFFGWNGSGGSGYGWLVTFGYSNQIRMDGLNIYLQRENTKTGADERNIALGLAGFGGGNRVFGILDAATDPSTNPTGGIIVYSSGGDFKVRNDGGNVHTLGDDCRLSTDASIGADAAPTSTADINGSIALATVAKTGAYTAAIGDHVITCDASGGAFTVTLPAASGVSGRIYHVKKTDSSGNAVTVDGNSSETIDGATTQAITAQYDSMMIICTGSEWFII